MISENIRAIQSGKTADDLFRLFVQQDAIHGGAEGTPEGRVRLSDGTILARSEFSRVCGFLD